MLIPRQKTPDLKVETLAHGKFDPAKDGAENFTLVTFYRGLHCPICATYLRAGQSHELVTGLPG